jgi:uncharacterized protein
MSFLVHSGTKGITFEIKVQPGAKQTKLAGTWNQVIKVKVVKKPEAGAANQECLKYLAKCLEVPRQALRILKGEFSARKVVLVVGLSAEVVRMRLEHYLA